MMFFTSWSDVSSVIDAVKKWDMNEKKLILYTVIVLLLCVYCAVARAQEYTITESQLQTLEQTLTSLESSKQKALEQATKSAEKAQSLEKLATDLVKKLEAQTNTTTELEKSLSRYEKQNAQIMADNNALQQQVCLLEKKNKNKLIVILVLLFIIFIIVVLILLYLYLKIKKIV